MVMFSAACSWFGMGKPWLLSTLTHKMISKISSQKQLWNTMCVPLSPAGAEKIIHGVLVCRCVQDHWNDDDFVLCKIDLTNAFNMVSCQALLEECATHFPELFPWVSWCYGQHPKLWHPMGVLVLNLEFNNLTTQARSHDH